MSREKSLVGAMKDSDAGQTIKLQISPSTVANINDVTIEEDEQVKEQVRSYVGWLSTCGVWELKGMGEHRIVCDGKNVLVYYNRSDNKMQYEKPDAFHRASVASYCILRKDVRIYETPLLGEGVTGKAYIADFEDEDGYLHECFEIQGTFMRSDSDPENCKMIYQHQIGGFIPVEDLVLQETDDEFYFAARYGFNDEWEHLDGDFDEVKAKDRAKVLMVTDSNQGDVPLWGTTLSRNELEELPRYWWTWISIRTGFNRFGYDGVQRDWLGEWTIGKEAGTGAQLLFITLRHYLIIVLGVMLITAYNMDRNRAYENPLISTKEDEGSMIASTTPGGLFYSKGNSNEVQNQFLICHTLVVLWVLVSVFVLERRKTNMAQSWDVIKDEASEYALELSNLPLDCTNADLLNQFQREEFQGLYKEVCAQFEESEAETAKLGSEAPEDNIAEQVKKDIERMGHETEEDYRAGSSMMVKNMCVVGRDKKAYLDAMKKQSEHDIVLCQLKARLGLDKFHGQELDRDCCMKCFCPVTKALQAALDEERTAFEDASKEYYKEHDLLNKTVAEGGNPCNGRGFVVFRWIQMARAVNRWYNPSACDYLKHFMNTITCGYYSCFAPAYAAMAEAPPSLKTAQGNNDKSCCDGVATLILPFPGEYASVTAKQAPQPRLIIWENFSADERQRFKVKIKMRFYLLLACIISCALQWSVEYGKQSQIEATKGNQTHEELDVYESAYVSGVCYAASTFTLVLLTVISSLCYALNDAQPHENTTTAAQALLEKRYVVYVLNTVVFLYLVNTNPSGGGSWFKTVGWYQAGGLGEAAFWLALSNAIIPSIQVILGTWDWIMIAYGRFTAHCQRQLDNAWKPLEFDFAEAYATALKSMAICFLFLPILPLVVYPTIVALIFQYIAAKYYLLRFSHRPFHSDELGAANKRLFYLILMAYIVLLPIVYCGEGVGGGLKHEEQGSTLDNDSSADWVYVYAILIVFGFIFCSICSKPLLVLAKMLESATGNRSVLKKGKPYPRGRVHVDMRQQKDGPLSWSYTEPPKRKIRTKVNKVEIRRILEQEAEAAAAAAAQKVVPKSLTSQHGAVEDAERDAHAEREAAHIAAQA